MRGRVAAVNSIFIGASNPLGEFESGVTAAAWTRLFPDLARRVRMSGRRGLQPG